MTFVKMIAYNFLKKEVNIFKICPPQQQKKEEKLAEADLTIVNAMKQN